MTRKPIFTSVLMAAALSLAVGAAGAQDRDRGQRRGDGGRAAQHAAAPRQEAARQAVPRSAAPRQEAARQEAARQPAPRAFEPRQYSAPQAARQPAPRAFEPRQYSAPQAAPRQGESRSYSVPQAAPREPGNRPSQGPRAVPRGYNGAQAEPHAVPRPNGAYRSPGYRDDDRRGYGQPRGDYRAPYYRPYTRPYNYRPYRPYYFSSPYYAFRPHLHLDFGLWLGFGVPYPWAYFGTYRPHVYGYYPGGFYSVMPDTQYYGGLSFDVQPSDAQVYVDGGYAGTVDQFTPYSEPLTLLPGPHRIAIVRDGYRTIEWDVTIQAGVVLPYRGAMVPW